METRLSNLDSWTDEKLLDLLKKGTNSESRLAMATIYKRYVRDVWCFVQSKVNEAASADDITQETWIFVVDKIHGFEWRGTPFKSWLFSIAHRKTLEFLTRSSRFQNLPYEDLNDSQVLTLSPLNAELDVFNGRYDNEEKPPLHARPETFSLLQKAIDVLPKKLQQIILLIYYGGLENATEIGQQLDMPPSTVRVYHKRALAQLKASVILKRLWEE